MTSSTLPETHFFLSRSSYPVGGDVVGTILILPKRQETNNDDANNGGGGDVETTSSSSSSTTTANTSDDLRSLLESVTVYVAGYNKIDPRWHRPSDYRDKIYGPIHPLIQSIQLNKGFDLDLLGLDSNATATTATTNSKTAASRATTNATDGNHPSSNVVCFWATNGLECLDLPEREVGVWEGWVREKKGAIVTDDEDSDDESDDDDEYDDEDDTDNKGEEYDKESTSSTDNDGTDNDDTSTTSQEREMSLAKKKKKTRKNLLAFSFRAKLPPNPPSVHGTTCRYYYTAHVLIKTASEQQVLKRNFQVTTDSRSQFQPQISSSTSTSGGVALTSGRVKFGTCVGVAHSVGLPCHLSSMDIHRPIGQISVQGPFDIRKDLRDVQTIRVCTSSTPSRFVCTLTIIGSRNLTPNGRIQLHWDFPSTTTSQHTDDKSTTHDEDVPFVPCYQIAACLKGEEKAVYEDGTTKRTQGMLFDTCHEYIVPSVTRSISKTLWLDGSKTGGLSGGGDRTPCEVSSDIMDIKASCQVDITIQDNVGSSMNSNGSYGDQSTATYSNLCLEFPVRVRHYLENEDEIIEQQENEVKPLKQLLGLSSSSPMNDFEASKPDDAFFADDIKSDLKTLSLKVEELVRLESYNYQV